MIPRFTAEREAEGKLGGEEESKVLLEGREETEQLMFIDRRGYNIFRRRDHDKEILGCFSLGQNLCWRWSHIGRGAIC